MAKAGIGNSASAAERVQAIFPNWKITTSAATGAAAGEILGGAERFHPDLIVLGERIRSNGTQNVFLGPVSQRILTEASCSVRIKKHSTLPIITTGHMASTIIQ